MSTLLKKISERFWAIMLKPYNGLFHFVEKSDGADLLIYWGLVCLAMSPFMRWLFVLPTLGALPGMDYPLWGKVGLPFSFHLNSAGVAVSLLILLTLAQVVRRKYSHGRGLFIMAAVWAVGLYYLANLALMQPSFLDMLDNKTQHFHTLGDFILSYLNPLYTYSVYSKYLPGTGSILFSGERLSMALQLLREGWYLAMMGALLVYWGYSARSGAGLGKRVFHVVLVSAMLVGALAMVNLNVFIADVHLMTAEKYSSEGDFPQAANQFLKAREINPRLTNNFDYSYELGQVLCRMGREETPEALVYQAQISKDPAKTASFYERALELAPDSWLFKTQYARFLLERGREEYAASLADRSIYRWQRALALDPEFYEAHFLLAGAFYAKGDYGTAMLENQLFLKNVNADELVAEAYNNMGDCLRKTLRHNEARKMYLASIKYSCVRNYRAVKALRGM